ncbi:hypothetical protein KKG24_00335 [Patescibacteria group bacterium]|nr:hypothetical protein [Patescibacteria group bacterium]
MTHVEKRLTDVKLNYNIAKLLLGLLFVAISTAVGFTPRVELSTRAILTVTFVSVGSYLLATSQKLGKDIALKIQESVQVKARIHNPKVKIDNYN